MAGVKVNFSVDSSQAKTGINNVKKQIESIKGSGSGAAGAFDKTARSADNAVRALDSVAVKTNTVFDVPKDLDDIKNENGDVLCEFLGWYNKDGSKYEPSNVFGDITLVKTIIMTVVMFTLLHIKQNIMTNK